MDVHAMLSQSSTPIAQSKADLVRPWRERILSSRPSGPDPSMAESDREDPSQRLLPEPQVLANIPPSIGQRRTARILVLALLAILAATWPFATVKLPEIRRVRAFPCSGTICQRLRNGSSIVRSVLNLASLGATDHCERLRFFCPNRSCACIGLPGCILAERLFGSGLQSAVWLYWFWHAGLPLAIIGYALLRNADRAINVRWSRFAISSSVAATIVLVVGMLWFVTQHHDLLPVTFVDGHPLSFFRRIDRRCRNSYARWHCFMLALGAQTKPAR